MKTAILADVDPAKIHLEQVKYKVATAIGQKVSEVKMEPLFRVTCLYVVNTVCMGS